MENEPVEKRNSSYGKLAGDTQPALRIVWVEDRDEDRMLAEREMKKAGLKFTCLRVETGEDFSKGLQSFSPDLVLSDNGKLC